MFKLRTAVEWFGKGLENQASETKFVLRTEELRKRKGTYQKRTALQYLER